MKGRETIQNAIAVFVGVVDATEALLMRVTCQNFPASVEVSPIPIRVRKVKLGISYSNQLSIRYCYYEVVPLLGTPEIHKFGRIIYFTNLEGNLK